MLLEDLALVALRYHNYQQQGILDAYDFQFRTKRYLRDIHFSRDTTLEPGNALVLTRRSLLLQDLPDTITVLITGHNAQGDPISASKQLLVVNHTSNNNYSFSVKGRWIVVGSPSIHSHYRWGTLEEFALDLTKIGGDCETHSGQGTKLLEYYAWGAPTYAIEEGVVVSVRGDIEESDSNLQQSEENAEGYFQRMLSYQEGLLTKGFEYTLGNHMVIQHTHDEYSRYVHLQSNRLRVKVGDHVVRWQQIANLGHSGNSTEPHLHFDLADGPDFAYSRSIPLSFENIILCPDDDGSVRHLHLGQIIFISD